MVLARRLQFAIYPFWIHRYICVFRGLRAMNASVVMITQQRQNSMIGVREKVLLRKRSLIETVFDYLKNKFQLEHARHRSPCNAIVHILSTLIPYSLKSHKPKIKFNHLIPN